MKAASDGDPGTARFAFVYAVALQSSGKVSEGRSVLEAAFARHPGDADITAALLQDALRAADTALASPLAQRLIAQRPDDHRLAELAERLRS